MDGGAPSRGVLDDTPSRDGGGYRNARSSNLQQANNSFRRLNSEQATPARGVSGAVKRKAQPYPLGQQSSAEAREQEICMTKEKRAQKAD